MHLNPRKVAIAAGAVILVCLPRSSHAAPSDKDKAACIAAFDEGQRSKSDHHLKLAQTQLLACTKEICPPVLRADCAEVLRAVQGAVPSIVLAADDAGRDITDVKVSNGSETLAPSLDGKAIELDPGTYELKFERASGKSVSVPLVLREGEKNRTVRVSFGEKKPFIAPLPPPVREPRSVAGYAVPGAFATIGLAGFAVAVIARLQFNNQVDELRAGCAPNCTQELRAEVSSKVVASNIGLGIGIGGLVLAAASWFIFSPGTKQPPAPTTAALTW